MKASKVHNEGHGSTQPNLETDRVILTFQDVHKRYGRLDALRGVTLEAPLGKVIGLLGMNGSGKSTLLKLAAGLLHPTMGEVRVAGRVPDRVSKAQIAFSPEVDHLYPWMTVKETLAFVRSFYPDWDAAQEERLLSLLELSLEKRVGELSKGQRARLRLLLTFARTAPLVLLDEPLSGIDPPSRNRIVKGILSAYRPGEQTVILSTHEVIEAESLFDQLWVLSEGKIKLAGNADELRSQYGMTIQDMLEEVL